MKNLKTLFTLLIAVLCYSCTGSTGGEGDKTGTETPKETPSGETQKGDYTRLYAMGNECKITTEEVANLFDVDASKITTRVFPANRSADVRCEYRLALGDNTVVFKVSAFRSTMDQVTKSFKEWTDPTYVFYDYVSRSASGDQLIEKHVNQERLFVLNPNYENELFIEYGIDFSARYKEKLNASEAQKAKWSAEEERIKQIAYKAIDFLEEKYRD
ncbi:hypothetical protein [Pedobacter endophyticus]|uniref:Lipoprotein n=1 Tax=Pedobacter endophyticus TaxID=2789740 RepID=A0A7S9L0G7_9SPHI|nr:hypothetical protein [Pedobacter endophyticus]QPH40153.1 hypothetical protein IZT61_02410 [Pedobacter endophyticus]